MCRGEALTRTLATVISSRQTTRYPVTATTATLPSPSTPRLLHSFLLSIPPTYSPPLLYNPTPSIPPAILTPLRSAPLPIPPPVAHQPLWYDVTSHLKPPANLPFHHAEPYHHHPPTHLLLLCCVARLHATTAASKKSHSPPLQTRPDSARLRTPAHPRHRTYMPARTHRMASTCPKLIRRA